MKFIRINKHILNPEHIVYLHFGLEEVFVTLSTQKWLSFSITEWNKAVRSSHPELQWTG
jgi:hypothetical protein